ncbi:MAG: hypothetical protein WDW36_009197 [Sanguina aurantia]
MKPTDQVNLRDLLGDLLLLKSDGKVFSGDTSSLDGKYVALYFSAHWCPPCRGFTPKLRTMHSTLLSQGKAFEVVFVSSDQSLQQFEDYYAEMPWAAVPYSSSQLRAKISRHFGIQGIPALIMVSPDGAIINRNARTAVLQDPAGANFPWAGLDAGANASSGMPNPFIVIILLVILYYYLVAPYLKGSSQQP